MNSDKFDGPRWVNLPGAYIRNKLADINDLFKIEGQNLLMWIKNDHSHAEIGNFP